MCIKSSSPDELAEQYSQASKDKPREDNAKEWVESNVDDGLEKKDDSNSIDRVCPNCEKANLKDFKDLEQLINNINFNGFEDFIKKIKK